MLTEKQILLLKTIGKLNCLDKDSLKHFGFGKKIVKKLISEKLICKTKLSCSYIPTLYILTKKGRVIFKNITEEKISRSRSLKHDYYHTKNILSYLSLDNINSYQNERYIRNKYKEEIKTLEDKGYHISCPDCCLVVDDKLVYIETMIDYVKPRLQAKKNFTLLDKNMELIVFRKNNRLVYHYKGGDTLC